MAWGRLTTSQAQEIARVAQMDTEVAIIANTVRPRLAKMASAGQFGRHSGNVARDVHALFPKAHLRDAVQSLRVTAAFWKGALLKREKVDKKPNL